MFKDLEKYATKPELYAKSTSSLWDDEHISKGMLEAHLDPKWDAASRNHAFIDKSVKWIATLAPPSDNRQLLDLGCGPGLYAERFSSAGYSVTGIDFSKRSVEYAKKQTERNKSNITYHYQDYLSIDYKEQFDVVTLIYCDYAVLSKPDRINLLTRIHRALRPGGRFIFDVFTPKTRRSENRSWEYCKNGGFFCEKPYVHLSAVYHYDDDDRTQLSQHIVITEEKVDCYNIYDHFFDKKSLLAEVQDIGFIGHVFYDDVSGKEFSGTGKTICCVLMR